MKSKAKTVAAYIAEVPEERRAAIKAVRAVLKKQVPKGYVESMGYGMITWTVPLATYPDTYNGQPLCYAALSSQKQYMAVYLMTAYSGELLKKLQAGFKARGKKLDMGKSCIRFNRLEDLPPDVIGDIAAAVPVKKYIEIVQAAHPKKK